jgi:hypothetical protein
MLYKDRIVAYIDILGFTEAIGKTMSEDEEIVSKSERISSLFDCIRKALYRKNPFTEDTRIVQQFSDLIIISYSPDQISSVFRILLDILYLQAEVLNHNFFLRGSVVFGKIFRNSEKIFGPAFIEAYKNEGKLALYPRVIVDKNVIALAEKYYGDQNGPDLEKRYVLNLLKKDFDGQYFIDYFRAIETEFDYGIQEMPDYLRKLRSVIEGLKCKKEPSIKSKYSWLVEKFNQTIDKYQDLYSSREMNDIDPDETQDFMSLQKIQNDEGAHFCS